MTEFTGERVIPGEVNDDLFAEHIARYAFAARFAANQRVLDIGCGTGYGAAELSNTAAAVVGIDNAPEAIAHARANYPCANARFLQASATSLPFVAESFDLVTAFEVIEHLEEWRALLQEVRRVLRPQGTFLVSTPNKLYYAESRAEEGPNPFHVHEFEFAEFRNALLEYFPHADILLQNRMESFSFSPHQLAIAPLDARIDGTRGGPAEAHFFLAICTIQSTPELRTFVYVPRASNVLREREQHIKKLAAELATTKQWLADVTSDRQRLIELHAEQTKHLEEHNRWAMQLETDWKASLQRVSQLQDELKTEQAGSAKVVADYEAKLTSLEEENRLKTQWAVETEARLTEELTAKGGELAEAVRLLDTAEATVTERTVWAQQLQSRVEILEAQLRMIRDSRWVKLGRVAGVGPRVEG